MIAVITPMGSTLYGATHRDVVALASPEVHLAAAFGMATLQDRLIGAARSALHHGASQIAIIEADMRVPENAITTLLRHRRDIVGANYRQRTANTWTAFGLDDRHISSLGRVGLERVKSLGCGCMLIDARVFRSLPQPWFSAPWSAEHEGHIGIDYYFCRHADAHGFWSWVDHDLSQAVRHIAEVELGIDGIRYLTSQEPLSIQWVDT